MQNGLGARVKAQRNKKGWSQSDLAKRADLSQGAISQLENGSSENSRHLSAIAKALGVSTEHLTEGIEQTSSHKDLLQDYVMVGDSTGGDITPHSDDYVMIDQYDVVGSCGNGHLMGDVAVKGGLVFKRDWINAMGIHSDNLATIYAQGDSMSPTIENGQVLLVDKSAIQPQSTKIYIICIDGQLYIKRLINLYDRWVMRSDNPDKSSYPDIEISSDTMSKVDVQGRIVWQAGVL